MQLMQHQCCIDVIPVLPHVPQPLYSGPVKFSNALEKIGHAEHIGNGRQQRHK